ncbi:hypothetical protein LCGC14_3008230, partial [marine sediment metagenome]
LGIRRVLTHPDAGILSAYGIGMADFVRHRSHGVYRPYDERAVAALDETFEAMAADARAEVLDEGVPDRRIEVHRSLDLRYQGLDAYLTVGQPDDRTYGEAYEAQHKKLYGYTHQRRKLEIVAARVEVVGRSLQKLDQPQEATSGTPRPQRTVTSWFDARPHETRVFIREKLQPGHTITGPAIVCEPTSTTVIDPGWRAEVLGRGELLLQDHHRTGDCPNFRAAKMGLSPSAPQPSAPERADPIMLEIFNNQFAGIAEQMGITLRNTSSSVNVKERLDFSCAIFTPTGELVVNAPHIPVHLGAMSETVRAIVAENEAIKPGDVFVTNDPYRGGSHLPDVTVVTPVVDPKSGRLLFFTAGRAHHA